MTAAERTEQPKWHTPALVAVVAAGLAVFALVAALRPGANFDDRSFVEITPTRAVQSAVGDTVVALYSFDPATIDRYIETVRPKLAGPMLCEFDETAPKTVQFVTSTQTRAVVAVDAVGVTDLGNGIGTAIVSLTSTWSEGGTPKGTESRQLIVSVERSGESWLVADVTDPRESGRSDDCRRSN